MTVKEKLAYLAGLVDGEGSVNITQYRIQSNKNIRWRPSIKMTMTDREPVELFGKFFGFNVTGRKYKNNYHKFGRTVYTCDAAWRGCKRILKQLYPYLVAKKKLAKIVIEFCEHVSEYKKNKRPMLRNRKGQLIQKTGAQMSYEEAKWRYETFCKVKKLVHPKSTSVHRKRLSEEALKQIKQLEEMRQSELKGNESSEG